MTQTNEPNQDSTPSSLSRRVFLGAGVSAAAALAFPQIAKAQTAKPLYPINCSTLKQFPQPCIVQSQNCEAYLRINVREETVVIPDSKGSYQTITARTYDGRIPGNSIYVNPGDSIKIDLTNHLNPDDPSDNNGKKGVNQPAHFNTTNLHFHGLHVSPSTDLHTNISSDDVLMTVAPNGKHSWCVQLPEFHAPGTHWYHAHLHGATGLQVAKGMAGAIIIKESQSIVPGKTYPYNIVPEADDKIFLIQELIEITNAPDQYTQDCAVYGQNPNPAPNGTPGQFIVNGAYQPVVTVSKNQLQRWRFINATGTPRGFMNLELCAAGNSGLEDTSFVCNDPNPPTIYLMAVDGISFYGHPPRPISGTTGWKLAPGNRADFLVSLKPGIYKLIKGADASANSSKKTPQILAYIQVKDTDPINPSSFNPATDTIPGAFPNYLKPICGGEIEPKSPQIVEFSVPNRGNTGCPDPAGELTPGSGYKINGGVYNSEVVDYTVKLNTAEEWHLSNKSFNRALAPHPFHIHVNPFQIVCADTPELKSIALIDPTQLDTPENRIWWDTIAVQPDQPPLKIWHRFLDYHGEFVIHCHILIHEDQGMMKNVKICNDGTGTGPCKPLKEGAKPNLSPGCESSADCTSKPASSPAQPSPQPSSSTAPSPKAAGNGGGGGGGGRGTGGGGGGKPR